MAVYSNDPRATRGDHVWKTNLKGTGSHGEWEVSSCRACDAGTCDCECAFCNPSPKPAKKEVDVDIFFGYGHDWTYDYQKNTFPLDEAVRANIQATKAKMDGLEFLDLSECYYGYHDWEVTDDGRWAIQSCDKCEKLCCSCLCPFCASYQPAVKPAPSSSGCIGPCTSCKKNSV